VQWYQRISSNSVTAFLPRLRSEKVAAQPRAKRSDRWAERFPRWGRLPVFCVGLFPENGCRFSLNDGGTDPIISGQSVV
jgi:hypothetical protein